MPLSPGKLPFDPGAANQLSRPSVTRTTLNLRVCADVVLPVSGPPIRDGAILVDGAGRIAAVGPQDTVPSPETFIERKFPDAVLLPGLVNAHTHLELTDLGGPLVAVDFLEWLQHVKREVAARSADQLLESARRGLRDTWRSGITTVGDTGSSGATALALSELGGRGVFFQEVFGPDPALADEAIGTLRKTMSELAAYAGDNVILGVSPHAPYTVSGALYERVVEFARTEKYPMAVHLAESPGETDLLVRNAGPFADSLTRRSIPLPLRAESPVLYVRRHGVLDTDLLAIHCVQTDRRDWKVLAEHGCAIATCPTSNQMHGHGAAPLPGFEESRIRVGVGTDSVASVGTIDLLREVRSVRRALEISAESALRYVTCDGAAALNLYSEIGSLEVGKWADFIVLRVKDPNREVEEQVLNTDPSGVLATFVAGECRHEHPDVIQ